jgi:peptide/nickel transport system substrate-binding protein
MGFVPVVVFRRTGGLVAIVSLLLSLLVAGPAHGRELRIGVASHVQSLDAQEATSNAQAQILYNIFDTLIERDNYAAPLKFVPGLATSWKMVSPTSMELKLREGVVMHDGTIMDADDVKFSLERVFNPKDPRFKAAQGRFFYNFKSVDVVDEHTVRVNTYRPDPLMETLLSERNAGITSKEYVERVGNDAAALKPVGSGPYKVESLKPNEEAVLVRHERFRGERPPYDKLVYIRIPEVAARITALVNHEVDFITNVPPDQEAAVKQVPGFKVVGYAIPIFHIWVINMSHPMMKSPDLRKALNLAIDREKLVQALWAGKGKAPRAHQFAEYGEPMYMPDLDFYRYDPAEAKRLLAKAGYKGEPIEIVFFPQYYLYGDLAAQAVADMWKKVGINVKLRQSEPFFSGADHTKVMMQPWSNPLYYPDPMGVFDTHWSAKSWVSAKGLWKPSSPEWAATYEKARFALDPIERRNAYRKLLALADKESGWVMLYQPYEAYAMREDIDWRIPTAQRPYVLTFRAGQISEKGH